MQTSEQVSITAQFFALNPRVLDWVKQMDGTSRITARVGFVVYDITVTTQDATHFVRDHHNVPNSRRKPLRRISPSRLPAILFRALLLRLRSADRQRIGRLADV